MRTIRIATRTSALALAQARCVAQPLQDAGYDAELIGITTRGDADRTAGLREIGGDGVFVKELQNALLDGRADVAVHSMKDLPTELPPDLCAGAVLERGDARDALVTPNASIGRLEDLPRGAVLGTSSLRRKAMIALVRSDLETRDLRGNVDTRVRKVLEGAYDAAVLAMAGLQRLHGQSAGAHFSPLPVDTIVPAAAQGAIYAQCRTADMRIRAVLAPLNHAPTATATSMERAFLRRTGGGCLVPIGVHATIDGTRWRLVAAIAAADGSKVVRREREGALTAAAEAIKAAEALAEEMLAAGGMALVEAFRNTSVRWA